MSNTTLLLLICTLALTGCAQQSITVNHRSAGDAVPEPDVRAAADKPGPREENVSVAEPKGVLTLEQALALTTAHNPALKASSLDIRAAQARQLQAGLWPNPEIEVEVENVGGSGELSGFDGTETTVQLSQRIELGNKAQKREKIASFERELADQADQANEYEIVAQAAEAFIFVLKAQEQLRLSDELLKLSQASFETVEKRVRVGKDSNVEKNRAAIVLANATIANARARRDLDYARKYLSSFWAQETPTFERALGNLETIEPLPTFEKLVNQMKSVPEYTQWETHIKRSRAVLDLETSKASGDITIGAGVKQFNETDDSAFVFGVSIPLGISDRNQGGRQEAAYHLAQSRQQQKAAWLKMQNELSQVYRELANAYHQIVSMQNEVLPAATKMFDAASKAYQEGKVDYLNMLDAQRTFFDIKNEYIEALAAYHIANTEIACCVGGQSQMIQISESEN